jgi:predicted acylesterase/phospholipase RssA
MAERDAAPSDCYCDVVMKGGIASGIVYPLAVALLARHFRFHSIGGTSAGAVAAAVTAAAEYRRRGGLKDQMAGFEVLAGVPAGLRASVDANTRRLMHLFQPQPGCQRLFRVLYRILNHRSATRRLAGAMQGFVEAYWPAAVGSALIGCLGWWVSSSLLAGVCLFLLALPASIALWAYFDLTRNVVKNGFGLCRGTTVRADGVEAITPWLNGLIQTAAGRPQDCDPLTFGDLWSVGGFPPPWAEIPAGSDTRSIDLCVFTTNLAHGRPYIFPYTDPEPRLFYSSEELARYVPPWVLNWIDEHAVPYVPDPDAHDPPAERARELKLRQIPEAKDFPILLAARMSFSFPLLFSAVPLWSIDYDRPDGHADFERCWFSDGGISSNFPIHLFDGLLPAWPTFGIELEDKVPGSDEMVFLPMRYDQGYRDRWDRFDTEKKTSDRFGGFLVGVIGAMQNWNDNTQARMAGVRDRVVRVRLRDNEGGFNLNMPAKTQQAVSARGEQAAMKLLDRFAAPARGGCGVGWDAQRWARLDVLVRTLAKRLPGVKLALQPSLPHATSYPDLVLGAKTEAPAGHDLPLTDLQRKALDDILQLCNRAACDIALYSNEYRPKPIPEPELRVRPPL